MGKAVLNESEGRYDRDMRSRAPLFLCLLAISSLALPFVAHAGIPFFGPIIDKTWTVPDTVTGGVVQCALGWGAVITVINNIISLLLTLAIVFVAPIMIAYAGFLYVVNPFNPSGIAKAKGILLNTVIGIIIALAGYLIVAAIMAVLYNPSAVGATWSSLITSGNALTCLPQQGIGTGLNQSTNGAPSVTVTGAGSLNTPPSGKAGTACDPSIVQIAAAAGGYTLSTTQANTLACIAQPESNCGAPHNPPNYNWNSARSSPGSTAAGAFQVLLSSNHSCYENSACYTAAGVNGSLNCQNGFDGNGNPKTDSAGAALVQKCVQAANNLNCSASAAACLLQKNSGSFSPWQADVNSARQTGCITSGA